MAGLRRARLAALPATFTTGQAELGLCRRGLYALRAESVVSEISRGVCRKAEAPETAHVDLLAVAHRAPLAVVCLISALTVYELTDEVPAVVHTAVPRGLIGRGLRIRRPRCRSLTRARSSWVSESVRSRRGSGCGSMVRLARWWA